MIDILPLRKERARHPETLLERRSVVAVLLRRILRRRTGFHRAPAHRATANATLSAAKDACGVRAILPRPERWGLPSRGARRFSSFRASHFHPTGWQPPETLPRLKTGFFFCDHGGGKGWIAAPGDRFASFRPSDAPPPSPLSHRVRCHCDCAFGCCCKPAWGFGLVLFSCRT